MNWYTIHYAATNPIERLTAGLCRQAFDIIRINVIERKQYINMEFQLFPKTDILNSILPERIRNRLSEVFLGMYLIIKFPQKMVDEFYTHGMAGLTHDDQGFLLINVDLKRSFSERDYRDFYNKLQFTIRHELEHFVQIMIKENTNERESAPNFNRATSYNDLWDKVQSYYLNPSELEAFVTGFYYQAKKTKQPFKAVVSKYLYEEAKIMSTNFRIPVEEVYMFMRKVYDKYLAYAQQRYPNVNNKVPQQQVA